MRFSENGLPRLLILWGEKEIPHALDGFRRALSSMAIRVQHARGRWTHSPASGCGPGGPGYQSRERSTGGIKPPRLGAVIFNLSARASSRDA